VDDYNNTMTEKFYVTKTYVDLIFEVRSEVADLKYRMEQLDHKVDMLLDLCSYHEYP
jgi:hypothetical protein